MIKHYNLGEKKNNKKCLKVWRKQVSPAIMGLKQLLIFYERKSFGLPAFIEDNTETSWMVFQSWTNVIWQRLIEKWLESFERKMKSVNFYNISIVLLLFYIGDSWHKTSPGKGSFSLTLTQHLHTCGRATHNSNIACSQAINHNLHFIRKDISTIFYPPRIDDLVYREATPNSRPTLEALHWPSGVPRCECFGRKDSNSPL